MYHYINEYKHYKSAFLMFLIKAIMSLRRKGVTGSKRDGNDVNNKK